LPEIQANSERIAAVEESLTNLQDRVNRVILRLIRTDQTVQEVEDKLNVLLSKVESETARLSELNDKC
jgi:phage shock protein A